jgi:hypothetical protein
MIPKSMPCDPTGWAPVFPWLTKAERVCAEIMLEKQEKAGQSRRADAAFGSQPKY